MKKLAFRWGFIPLKNLSLSLTWYCTKFGGSAHLITSWFVGRNFLQT